RCFQAAASEPDSTQRSASPRRSSSGAWAPVRRTVIYVARMRDAGARTVRGGPATPRLLVLTPDFPPAPGGIQVLTHRLVAGLEGFERRIVTLGAQRAARLHGG